MQAPPVELQEAVLRLGHRHAPLDRAVPVGRQRPVDQFAKGDTHLVLDQETAASQDRPSQGVGIARAGRQDPQEEGSRLRVEAIEKTHNRPFGRRRQGVIRTPREVMRVEGPGDALGTSIGLRVETTHDPLELGKLLDHLGGQVRLAQPHRRFDRLPADRGTRSLERFAHGIRQGDHALALAGVRSELLVKGHAGQPGRVLRERRLAILLPEKARIGEPGAQHPFVSVPDRSSRVRLRVGDRQESIQEARGGSPHRE